MREFKMGDKVLIECNGEYRNGVVFSGQEHVVNPILVMDDYCNLFYLTYDGRYKTNGPVILSHPENKKEETMNKLEITKENIWDIIDEKWNYIVASSTGTLILTEVEPKLTEKGNWRLMGFITQDLCGLKITPWWTDHKDSMLSRTHHLLDKTLDKMVKQTPKFKVGDKCVYKGDGKDYYGTIVGFRDACDTDYPITFSVDGKNGDIYSFTEDGRLLLGMEVCLFHVEEYNELCNTKKTVEQSFFAIDWTETFKNLGSAFNLHKEMTKKQKKPKFKVGDKVKIIEKCITESWEFLFGCTPMIGTVASNNTFEFNGFIQVNIDGWCLYFNESGIEKIEEPDPKSYLEGHKASGLKAGDTVRVTRKAKSYEGGWDNTWAVSMDKYVGGTFKILRDADIAGFVCSTVDRYGFPYFVLEKVS